MNRTVNLRAGCASLAFGDRESQEQYELEVERARAAQSVRYAVAPRQTLVLADGRRLEAGAEVRLEHFQQRPPSARRPGEELARHEAESAPP